MVQTIKDINVEVIEDPSLTKNIGGQSIQSGEVIVTSVIAAEDLELPSRDEEDETLADQPTVELFVLIIYCLFITAESPPPPPTKSKRLRKRTVVEYVATEEPAAAPTTTSGINEELREAFEAVEQEKEQEEGDVPLKEKNKEFEEEEEIPTEVIAESIALAELPVALLESEVEIVAAVPRLVSSQVEVPRTVGILAMMTSPLKPHIVAMPIHSLPGSSTMASFANPELAEVKIWQSIELELDENREAVNQLMKDMDLLHRQNMAPKPILEMSLGLSRDVLNLHDRYEDLKPTFKTSEFCKATHEANLADYAKQKAELDQMVAGYKEAKATADKLERQIEELQKQLAECREVQNKLGAGLSSKSQGYLSCAEHGLSFQASIGDCRGFNPPGGAASERTFHQED
ncbi:unnamed protein product [Prunus armeniaca]